MQCPFLRETQVESCRRSLFRKQIVQNPENKRLEKCSSPRYIECPAYQANPQDGPAGSHCPHLAESLVQYCAAASAPKYIPYSEASLSRCGSESFRYCDLYLAMAHPDSSLPPVVEGVALPSWLYYSPNHMWLDLSEDGSCHIGIDSLLANALGSVSRISFLTTKGVHFPAAVLTAHGAEFHMIFPNRILITGANLYLRANPAPLTADPYRFGWLFEGHAATTAEGGKADPRAGLLHGDAVQAWMKDEVRRLSEFVHGQLAAPADGGSFAPGFVAHLEHDQALELFHRFFSPYSHGANS
jgi:glycine cleavage system H lipoate-binding protein